MPNAMSCKPLAAQLRSTERRIAWRLMGAEQEECEIVGSRYQPKTATADLMVTRPARPPL